MRIVVKYVGVFSVHAEFVMGYIFFEFLPKKTLRIVLFKYRADNFCKRVCILTVHNVDFTCTQIH